MRSEAGYLPATLGEGGGTYRTTFRVEILARKFKNGREIQKMGAEIQKFKKIFGLRPNDKGGPLPLNGRFAAEGHFIQCKFGPAARGGVGTC